MSLGAHAIPIEVAADTQLHVELGPERPDRTRNATVRAAVSGCERPIDCASGTLPPVGPADDARSEGSDATSIVDSALGRCREHRSAAEFLLLAADRGIQFDQAFQGVRRLWRRDGAAVGWIRMPVAAQHAGWEVALQTLVAAWPAAASGHPGEVYQPIGFDRVSIRSELPAEFWSVSTVHSDAATGTDAVAEVVLVDADGRLLARFSGIRLRRLAVVEDVAARSDTPSRRRGSGGTPPPGSEDATTVDPVQGLTACVADILGTATTAIDTRKCLRDLGLDSLMAVQLKQRMRRELGADVTAGRLLGPESLARLAHHLHAQAASGDGGIRVR